MRTRITTAAITAALAITLAGCSSSDDNDASTKATKATSTSSAATKDADHYDSAQDIADALTAAGLNASKPQKETEETYITEVGGTAYNFTVTEKDSKAPGEAGINMFPNKEALAAWIPMSKSFGGVAVTGGTWAVSLPTDGKAARDNSKHLAPKIAEALEGTVQQ